MSGTCQTCTHWGKPDERSAEKPARRCLAIRHDESEAIRWDEEDWLYNADWCEDKRWVHTARAVAVDGSGYSAYILTRGHFGCVTHTPPPDLPGHSEEGA